MREDRMGFTLNVNPMIHVLLHSLQRCFPVNPNCQLVPKTFEDKFLIILHIRGVYLSK